MKKEQSDQLSLFQKEIISKIKILSITRIFSITKEEILGINEKYIYTELHSPKSGCIMIWVYEDECMIKNNDEEFYFEKYDFDNLDELQKNLFILIENLVNNLHQKFKHTFRKNLFKGAPL